MSNVCHVISTVEGRRAQFLKLMSSHRSMAADDFNLGLVIFLPDKFYWLAYSSVVLMFSLQIGQVDYHFRLQFYNSKPGCL